MRTLLSDLRYGARMLWKTPGATGTVLLALSLGIGVCALMFSMIGGAVLADLPVEGGDRVVRIARVEPLSQTAEDYATWTTRQRSFEQLGAVERSTVTLGVDGVGAEPVRGAAITPSVLPLLATEPALGRPFTAEDAAPGAPAVVLVSHEVWRDRLGSDPAAPGRVVRVNGRPAEVVGVMPEGFGFPWDQQVWSPLDPDPVDGRGGFTTTAETRLVVGRLREGITMDAAGAELTALTRELDRELRGAAGPGSAVRVAGYTDLFDEPGRSAALSVLLLGVALLVLLVACANVTNVLLARAVARRKEIGVRLAIGASRRRIAAQLLTEVSLLTALGAAGGVALAVVGARYCEAAIPPGMPYWVAFRVDWPVLGFVAAVAVVAALAAGLGPAVQASRANTHEVLKDESRGSSSLRAGRVMRRLIGVEIALSFVLLVLAGLFVRSAANFRAADFAFAPEEVFTARVRLPEATYADATARALFSERLLRTLAALPQVEGVALSTGVPGIGSTTVTAFEVEGATPAAGEGGPRTRSIVATPGYHDLFRAPVVAGRGLESRDRLGGLPVAVVNESFAQAHFPDGAVDRRIRYSGPAGEEAWLTIVGVTRDLLEGGVEGELAEAVYLPLAQHPPSTLQVVARSRGGFATLPAPVREAVAGLDPDVALFDVRAHDRAIDAANSQYTWFSALFLVSGAIALFLAALGLYGVMAFWVAQRTREIGVRMALGGQRGDVVRLVLGQGVRQTGVGLAAGLLLAVPAARTISFALYGVAPYDPLVFGLVVAALVGAATLGCWIPARRATRMDPLRALASE